MNRWGIPNWKDTAAYRLPDDRLAIRWEFLRRRADYREQWLRYRADEVGLKRACGSAWPPPIGFGTETGNGRTWTNPSQLLDYATDPCSTVETWNDSGELISSTGLSPAEQFGLQFLLNPAIMECHPQMWLDNVARRKVRYLKKSYLPLDLSNGPDMMLMIDMRKDIHQQLDDAKKSLLYAQRKLLGTPGNRKEQRSTLIKALRTLDADSEGCPLWEIANEIENRRPGGRKISMAERKELGKRGSRLRKRALDLQKTITLAEPKMRSISDGVMVFDSTA
jgi:hypothetical protein